jgi:GTP-binding protein
MGSHGRRWRIKYMVQVHHAPPIFRLFVSEGAVIPEHYERYLQHRLREDFDLPAIPLIFRWIRSRNPYKDGGK